MKGYEKYFPSKKNDDAVLIQAKIDPELHAQAKALLEREGLTWNAALSGLLAKLIDDSKSKSQGK